MNFEINADKIKWFSGKKREHIKYCKNNILEIKEKLIGIFNKNFHILNFLILKNIYNPIFMYIKINILYNIYSSITLWVRIKNTPILTINVIKWMTQYSFHIKLKECLSFSIILCL